MHPLQTTILTYTHTHTWTYTYPLLCIHSVGMVHTVNRAQSRYETGSCTSINLTYIHCVCNAQSATLSTALGCSISAVHIYLHSGGPVSLLHVYVSNSAQPSRTGSFHLYSDSQLKFSPSSLSSFSCIHSRRMGPPICHGMQSWA